MNGEVNESQRVVVLGGGPMGLFLSQIVAENQKNGDTPGILLWYADRRRAAALNRTHSTTLLHSTILLPQTVEVVSGYSCFSKGGFRFIIASSGRDLEDTLQKIISHLEPECRHDFLFITKGFASRAHKDHQKTLTYTDATEELLKKQKCQNYSLAAANGPSILKEMIRSHHSFFNLACDDPATAERWLELLENPHLHFEILEDLTGVQVCGALKNPIAVACGLCDALPFSKGNLQGEIIGKGFQEMRQLALALEVNDEIVMGRSGLHDLIAVSTASESRNRAAGIHFARELLHGNAKAGLLDGLNRILHPVAYIEDWLKENEESLEGARALPTILSIAEKLEIQVPLYRLIHEILNRKKAPETLIDFAMGKPPGESKKLLGDLNKPRGFSNLAGHRFQTLLENRVLRRLKNGQGKHQRIRKHAPLIVGALEKRFAKAKEDNKRRETESLPVEISLWEELVMSDEENEPYLIESLVKFYIAEISDNYHPLLRAGITRLIAPIRFMLSRFRPGGALPDITQPNERIKKMCSQYNVLYAPTHRSHLDSVEICLGLEWAGLPVPRYAAGSNLMTAPFATWLLKSMGSFSVDRERTRNLLYLECLGEYASMLLEAGIPSLVYPEGTRSRSGGIAPIKGGLLGAALDAYKQSGREVLVVPITLSYESVPEDLQFLGLEEKPAFFDFISRRSRVHMDICEPIRVSRFHQMNDPIRSIASEIHQAWESRMRILPNQILARIFYKHHSSLNIQTLEDLTEHYVRTHPGNYLMKDPKKIVKEGLKVLERRGFVKMEKDRVSAQDSTIMDFYGVKTPEKIMEG